MQKRSGSKTEAPAVCKSQEVKLADPAQTQRRGYKREDEGFLGKTLGKGAHLFRRRGVVSCLRHRYKGPGRHRVGQAFFHSLTGF